MQDGGSHKIFPQDLKEGMRFSAPVFFDDEENMFLAERKPLKKYQLMALARWSIPFVVTYGRQYSDEECAFIEKNEAEQKKREIESLTNKTKGLTQQIELVDVAEPIEELCECDDLEPIDELDSIDGEENIESLEEIDDLEEI